MKKPMTLFTNLIGKIRTRCDRKFRDRIDRVYFRHDGKGNRFIGGHLYVEADLQTLRPGDITALGKRTERDVLPPSKKIEKTKGPRALLLFARRVRQSMTATVCRFWQNLRKH